jgi:3-phenylpropionate/cinnamic acid dioxygenase small subunit
MALSAEQTLAIHQLLSLHGHLADSREYERFDEVLTDDIVCDMEGIGAGTLRGREALRAASVRLGDAHPAGHHVTNVLVTQGDDGEVRVRSKGIGIAADGKAGSVVYDDLLRLTPGGWRIAHRRILPGRTPVAPR